MAETRHRPRHRARRQTCRTHPTQPAGAPHTFGHLHDTTFDHHIEAVAQLRYAVAQLDVAADANPEEGDREERKRAHGEETAAMAGELFGLGLGLLLVVVVVVLVVVLVVFSFVVVVGG